MNKEEMMQKLNELIETHNLTENMVQSIVDGEDKYLEVVDRGICKQIKKYVHSLSGGKKY